MDEIDTVLAKYHGLPKLIRDELKRDMRTLIERARNDAKIVDKLGEEYGNDDNLVDARRTDDPL